MRSTSAGTMGRERGSLALPSRAGTGPGACVRGHRPGSWRTPVRDPAFPYVCEDRPSEAEPPCHGEAPRPMPFPASLAARIWARGSRAGGGPQEEVPVRQRSGRLTRTPSSTRCSSPAERPGRHSRFSLMDRRQVTHQPAALPTGTGQEQGLRWTIEWSHSPRSRSETRGWRCRGCPADAGSSRRGPAEVTDLSASSAVTEAERERPGAQPQRRPDTSGRLPVSGPRSQLASPRRSPDCEPVGTQPSRQTAYLASRPLAAGSRSMEQL